jgi:hypothetical protein
VSRDVSISSNNSIVEGMRDNTVGQLDALVADGANTPR